MCRTVVKRRKTSPLSDSAWVPCVSISADVLVCQERTGNGWKNTRLLSTKFLRRIGSEHNSLAHLDARLTKVNRRLECPKNLSHSENESRAGIDFSFHPSYKLPAKLRCGHDDSLYPQPVQCDCQSRKVGEQQRLGGWKYRDTVTRSKEETKVDARFGNSKFSIASFASDIRSFFYFFLPS